MKFEDLCAVLARYKQISANEIEAKFIDLEDDALFRRTISECDEVLARREDAKIYFCRGDAKKYFEDHEGAIDDFTNAIELQPDKQTLFEAFSERGDSRLELEDESQYPAAVKDFTRAISLANKKHQVIRLYLMRGTAYDMLGEEELAKKDQDKYAALCEERIKDISEFEKQDVD